MTVFGKIALPVNAGILLVIASLVTLHAEGAKMLVYGDGKTIPSLSQNGY